HRLLHSFPPRRSSDLLVLQDRAAQRVAILLVVERRRRAVAEVRAVIARPGVRLQALVAVEERGGAAEPVAAALGDHADLPAARRSEEHTSELQSQSNI